MRKLMSTVKRRLARTQGSGTKPVFILGVGAQKSGTSWLYSQLQKQDHCNFGCLKEYHIWDALYAPLCRGMIAHPAKSERPANAFRRMLQQQDGAYEAYFQSLLTPTTHVTGDITPSYSMLTARDFGRIKHRLETAGFQVKVVFLMRDPVQRIWSALRMEQRDQRAKGSDIPDADLIDTFANSYAHPQNAKRTDYPETVRALRQVFAPEDIYFQMYETLFTPDAIAGLERSLGVSLGAVDFSHQVNVSKPIPLPADIAAACRAHFRGVYAFCAQEFPQCRDAWTHPDP